eukprot:scaffold961_cov122-Cylindrotheca_fusiformis.AAC.23
MTHDGTTVLYLGHYSSLVNSYQLKCTLAGAIPPRIFGIMWKWNGTFPHFSEFLPGMFNYVNFYEKWRLEKLRDHGIPGYMKPPKGCWQFYFMHSS